MKLPLLRQDYQSRSGAISKAQLVNWFQQENPSEDEYTVALLPTPGTTSWLTASSGGTIRQLFEHSGLLYYIGADKFYSVNANKTETLIGSLNTAVGSISIAGITDEIMFVDGVNAYHYKISTATFTVISDVDFPANTTAITAQDGYFIATAPSSGSFYISSVNDGTAWNASDFASAEGRPDFLVNAFSHQRYLWLFGEYSTEVWFNSGNVTFPFERQNGISIEFGCAAANSVIQAGNELYWVGRNRNGAPVIMRSNGFSPTVISSRAVNYQIGTYSKVDDAYSVSYTLEGHEFVLFNFPTADKTWVFDITTALWHERDYFDGAEFHYYVASCQARFDNKVLIGARDSANIFEVSLTTYTDNGNMIRRKLVSDNLDVDMRRGTLYNLQVRVEPGIGLTSGQGSDPQMMLRVSKDFGNTWGNELWRSPGKKGEYKDRLLWTRLGEGRSFTFELTATDPCKWVIIGARIDLEITKD